MLLNPLASTSPRLAISVLTALLTLPSLSAQVSATELPVTPSPSFPGLQLANPPPPLAEGAIAVEPAIAQQLPQDVPRDDLPPLIPRDPIPPEPLPLPQEPLPPPEDLFQPPDQLPLDPDPPPDDIPLTVFVEQFQIEGNTVFDDEELIPLAWQATTLDNDEAIAELIRNSGVLDEYCPRTAIQVAEDTPQDLGATDPNLTLPFPVPMEVQTLDFTQLLRARSAITQLYINCGYITSGAILPPQTPEDQNNIVTIQVIEGELEDITVTGLDRLRPSYVRSRLAIAGSAPLNQRQLVEGLQLLQLNPLIQRISADLQTGTRPGTSILAVNVTEADTFDITLDLNNNRSPSVGDFQRGVTFSQDNLLGFGDAFYFNYNNTDGSNGIETGYTVPINPRNGTIGLRFGYTGSEVIEEPFDVLEISSESYFYEASYLQPVFQRPTEEVVLGLTLSHQESQTELGIDDIGPFPLSRGADDEGRTRVSAIRFTQTWLRRDPRQVLAFRSQFSVGVDALDATINDDPLPDSRFFAWRGQGQWVRLLNDSGVLLLVRSDLQLTGDSLLPLEQFGLGGQDSVRGYRQDALLTDNGINGTMEVRFPVLRIPEQNAQLSIVPFLDAGIGWNADSETDPEDQVLLGTGLGVLWELGDDLTVRLDWGIPLIDINNDGDSQNTWQENGVYFSIRYSFF